MKQTWEDIKSGYVIQMDDGRYIWDILANGHPENPVIYYTEYLWEAKAWKTASAAFKARNRVIAKTGGGDVWSFTYNEAEARRDIGQKCD